MVTGRFYVTAARNLRRGKSSNCRGKQQEKEIFAPYVETISIELRHIKLFQTSIPGCKAENHSFTHKEHSYDKNK